MVQEPSQRCYFVQRESEKWINVLLKVTGVKITQKASVEIWTCLIESIFHAKNNPTPNTFYFQNIFWVLTKDSSEQRRSIQNWNTFSNSELTPLPTRDLSQNPIWIKLSTGITHWRLRCLYRDGVASLHKSISKCRQKWLWIFPWTCLSESWPMKRNWFVNCMSTHIGLVHAERLGNRIQSTFIFTLFIQLFL